MHHERELTLGRLAAVALSGLTLGGLVGWMLWVAMMALAAQYS
jgi:hypothetical protein